MRGLDAIRYPIIHDASVFGVRFKVRELAVRIGFSAEVIEELVIVVSELASNILKYGRKGHIELHAVRSEGGPPGISIVAEDETPAFDLAGCLRDGHGAQGKLDPASVFGRGGIGAGLGAVARFSDGIELVAQGQGKRILVRRSVGPPRRGFGPAR